MIKLFQSPSLNYLKYLVHRLTVGISPKLEINRCFKKIFGHKANLVNPQSLIEKIYWMQLHCDTRQWTLFADHLLASLKTRLLVIGMLSIRK